MRVLTGSRVVRDVWVWLQGGTRGGRAYFWGWLALYALFCWMLAARDFAPVDAETGAVLTLSILSLTEASVRFAHWCGAAEGHPYRKDWELVSRWARPAVAAHVVAVWAGVGFFGSIPPLPAILMLLAGVAFGLAKTLPGLKIKGRFGNTMLAVAIAAPCLIVAVAGQTLGL